MGLAVGVPDGEPRAEAGGGVREVEDHAAPVGALVNDPLPLPPRDLDWTRKRAAGLDTPPPTPSDLRETPAPVRGKGGPRRLGGKRRGDRRMGV